MVATTHNNHMHSDSKKRRSSFLVALLSAAVFVSRYVANAGGLDRGSWSTARSGRVGGTKSRRVGDDSL